MAWPRNLSRLVRKDEALAGHTSFRIGGSAEFYAEPRDNRELTRVIRAAGREGILVRVMGGGTNILVGDGGVEGLVLNTTGLAAEPELVNGTTLLCRAGTRLSQVVRLGILRGFQNVEAFAGIPGTVGGAVMGNAGTRRGAMGDFARMVRFIDFAGRMHEVQQENLRFVYRTGPEIDGVITDVLLEFEKADPDVVRKRVVALMTEREATQPLWILSAGCVFRNPGGAGAGQLIESAGLKGARVGGAIVSEKHANYIINVGGASAEDVIGLIERIKKEVAEKLGVSLELELEIW
jgi:UDP-N-acetylmuramate dehydrogenase